jgi:hypothetical protein
MHAITPSQVHFLFAVVSSTLLQLIAVARFSRWTQVRDAGGHGTWDALNVALLSAAVVVVVPTLLRGPWWKRVVALLCCVGPLLFIGEFLRRS